MSGNHDDMGYDGAMGAALRGDDAFLQAIDAADRDTFGINCPCGCYHVGRFSEQDPNAPIDAACPRCGSTRGSFESPALGRGPASVRTSNR